MFSPSQLRVVLVRTRNPLNIGAAARAMANFGCSDLVVVDPFEGAWQGARSAVGAEDLLRKARRLSLEEAVEGCHLVLGTTAGRRRELKQPMADLPALPDFLAQRLPPGGKAALLFGSEKTGLGNKEFLHCHALVRVPTRPETPSMNLGQAVAVVLYELGRPAGGVVARPDFEPPTAEQLQDLVAKALAACERLDYMQHLPERTRAAKLRRAFLRWNLRKQDSSLIQAFLKRAASPPAHAPAPRS